MTEDTRRPFESSELPRNILYRTTLPGYAGGADVQMWLVWTPEWGYCAVLRQGGWDEKDSVPGTDRADVWISLPQAIAELEILIRRFWHAWRAG